MDPRPCWRIAASIDAACQPRHSRRDSAVADGVWRGSAAAQAFAAAPDQPPKRARSTPVCTLFAAFRGSASTNSMRRGFLKPDSRAAAKAPSAAVERGAGARHDHRGHLLAPLRVRRADDGDVGDVGVRAQDVLHLDRRDVLAAGDDQVLHAAGDEEVAVVVARPRSPVWSQPSRTARGGRGAIAVVAGHDRRAADDDLALLVRRRRALPSGAPHGDDDVRVRRARRCPRDRRRWCRAPW